MLNGDRETRPPVEAVPDIIASPSDSKKAKLDLDPNPDKSEKNGCTSTQDVKDSSTTGAITQTNTNTEDSPGAGPSSLPDQKVGEQQDGDAVASDGEGEMSFSVQPPTPEATASSLPVVERLEEEWTTCHMVWRGTIYDFKVEANDL